MTLEAIAEVFPLVATLATLIVLVLLIRVLTRRSAGATDAGPVEPERAPVPGLSATAWDLRSIEHGITSNPNETIGMLQGLCREQGIDDRVPGPGSHPPIDTLLTRLEQHLELVKPPQANPSNPAI